MATRGASERGFDIDGIPSPGARKFGAFQSIGSRMIRPAEPRYGPASTGILEVDRHGDFAADRLATAVAGRETPVTRRIHRGLIEIRITARLGDIDTDHVAGCVDPHMQVHPAEGTRCECR